MRDSDRLRAERPLTQLTRRELAPLVLGLVAGACAGGEGAPPPQNRFPLAAVPEGRSRVELLGEPVELFRDGDVVAARSLLCTHQGCEVRWRVGEERYACPCHEGRYDAEGRPVAGPPSRPLRAIATRIEGDAVVLEIAPAGAPAG